MKKGSVLYINHKETHCGVYQFGNNVFNAIKNSGEFNFVYAECTEKEELFSAIKNQQPVAVIYNYHPDPTKWLTPLITRKFKFPQIGVIHEVTQKSVNLANNSLFDFHISPDPTVLLTNPIVFKTGRLIPAHTSNQPPPAMLTIGSFGFGTAGKGFSRIIEMVEREFEEAAIRINIPFAAFGDKDGSGAKKYARECQDLIKKPGIHLQITHDFLSTEGVLNFLEQNTLNAFLYEGSDNRGISSVIDLALAVDRPIAISKTSMFRHILYAEPSICVEDNPLQAIVHNGVTPLREFKTEWTAENLCWDYERIVKASLQSYRKPLPPMISYAQYKLEKTPARKILKYLTKTARRSTNRDKLMLAPDSVAKHRRISSTTNKENPLFVHETLFNRILDNKARAEYDKVIDLLFELCPEEMSRKIETANIQQAFVFETVRNLSTQFQNPRILSVGCYEDTAYLSLQKSGYPVKGIDPLLDYDIATFITKPGVKENKYDIIFSTSVIEHVADDNAFMNDMAKVLNPGGFLILTCDYKEDYKKGDPIPAVDFRFYTKSDLEKRLPAHAIGCTLFGKYEWDCPLPDFNFSGFNYTFATLVMQKEKH